MTLFEPFACRGYSFPVVVFAFVANPERNNSDNDLYSRRRGRRWPLTCAKPVRPGPVLPYLFIDTRDDP